MILKEIVKYIGKNVAVADKGKKLFRGILTEVESDYDTSSGDYEAVISPEGEGFEYGIPISDIIQISELPKVIMGM